MLQSPPSPLSLQSEVELYARCQCLAGFSLAQLATELALPIPLNPLQRKGWVGMAIERALGATAGSKAGPDFGNLGIELKTIPINRHGKPAESTFVTSISLLTVHKEVWAHSACFAKLKRVLWFPVEAESSIPFPHRRLGLAVLWSPTCEQERKLEQDWSEFSFMIGTGRLAEIDARQGCYLQVRPKAANARALCYGFDERGNKILTLPRGFYLRSRFTAIVLASLQSPLARR